MSIKNFFKKCFDENPVATTTTPVVNPDSTSLIATIIGGIGLYKLGEIFGVAKKLAKGNETKECSKTPEEYSREAQSGLISKIEWLKKSMVKAGIKAEDKKCNENIARWAKRNRYSEFAKNEYAEDVYEIIMLISGHMLALIQLNGNIPDYLVPENGKYFSPLNLCADLMAWFMIEGTISENSPFLVYDDEMRGSDKKYMERTISELKGFSEAIIKDWETTGQKSAVIAYLEENEFISVSPLIRMKEAYTKNKVDKFIPEATYDEKFHLGDVNFTLLENFRIRLKENLEKPCMLARRYAKRKELLKEAKAIKRIVEILKEAAVK